MRVLQSGCDKEAKEEGVSINRSEDLWPADDRKRALSCGMPLLFFIQGGNEFLVIFQKCCLWAQASAFQGSGRNRPKETGGRVDHDDDDEPPPLTIPVLMCLSQEDTLKSKGGWACV